MRLWLPCLSIIFSVSSSTIAADTEFQINPSAITSWSWNRMGGLNEARELPRLVHWSDGRVLAIGGGSELRATVVNSTEIFDSKSKQWTKGPALKHPRRDAEVVTLKDGNVLAIGGSVGPTRIGTKYVEILDQKTGIWREAAAMQMPRIGHTATVLKDGRVLVVGGLLEPDKATATSEIYDPVTDTWSSAGEMSEARSLHNARQLHDGTVLVMGGGTDTTATDTSEIFDPKLNSWKLTAPLTEPRWGFASAVLDDGRVLVAGGRVPSKKGATLPDDKMALLSGAEIYDPSAKVWSKVASMNIPRSMGLPNVELIKLANGGYMFHGGRSYPAPYHGVSSAEYFNVTTGTWSMLSPMKIGRSYFSSIKVDGNRVLVVGGRGPQFLPLNQVECFEPAAKE